jgi:hypothetical protein
MQSLMLWMLLLWALFCYVQVNDFSADAIISQLLLLDAQDPTKVRRQAGGAGAGRWCGLRGSGGLLLAIRAACKLIHGQQRDSATIQARPAHARRPVPPPACLTSHPPHRPPPPHRFYTRPLCRTSRCSSTPPAAA